jgi:lipopolysaccharide/colanic/teichoic acid biosynthesis glycosyltransferase
MDSRPSDVAVTIELETPLLQGAAQASRCGASGRSRAFVGPRPWELPEERWEGLAPRGLYARRLRRPFLWLVALLLIPLALVLAVPIAFLNLGLHGSPRRILFAQARVGLRGRVFVLYKFRTMLDGPGEDCARVTRFGRFLRNTHLDELPQLLNVLRGDMCLIGPRPEMLSTERWAAGRWPDFSERLVLAPGLTGHAQITQGYTEGGDEEAYRQKLELNRRYRESLSFTGDCAILLRTALWMLRGRGWLRG